MDNLFLGMASSFRKLCLGFIQRYLNSSHCFNRQYGQFGHPFRGFRPPNPEMRKKWPISAELPGRFQPNWVAGFVRIPRPTCSESRNKIILLGFSRGAYTVRALAGFIAACGLLDATEVDLSDKMKAYVAAVSAWHQYRKQTKGDGIKDIFDWFPSIFTLFQGVQTTGKGAV